MFNTCPNELDDVQNNLEDYIKIHGHLPDMPSEKEILEKGIDISDMQAKQQRKIEELTLYIIDLQKKIDELSTLIQNTTK